MAYYYYGQTLQETLIITYGVDDNSISVETFSQSITSFTNMLHLIRDRMFPDERGYFMIVGTEPGSFKAILKYVGGTIVAGGIMVNVLSSALYDEYKERTGSKASPFELHADSSFIEMSTPDGIYRIPRDHYAAAKAIAENTEFRKEMSEAFRALSADEKVKYLRLHSESTSFANAVFIDRKDFEGFLQPSQEEEIIHVELVTTDMKLLSRGAGVSKPVWKLLWNGEQINAEIDDFQFKGERSERLQPGTTISLAVQIYTKRVEGIAKPVQTYKIIKVFGPAKK